MPHSRGASPIPPSRVALRPFVKTSLMFKTLFAFSSSFRLFYASLSVFATHAPSRFPCSVTVGFALAQPPLQLYTVVYVHAEFEPRASIAPAESREGFTRESASRVRLKRGAAACSRAHPCLLDVRAASRTKPRRRRCHAAACSRADASSTCEQHRDVAGADPRPIGQTGRGGALQRGAVLPRSGRVPRSSSGGSTSRSGERR